jgi:4-amino-4-deoxy-L-arabinose transferase-like glycosyltransferase
VGLRSSAMQLCGDEMKLRWSFLVAIALGIASGKTLYAVTVKSWDIKLQAGLVREDLNYTSTHRVFDLGNCHRSIVHTQDKILVISSIRDGCPRMAAGLLAIFLAFLTFATAREMFVLGAGFLALILAAFDPNLLGFGALVTTDTCVSCFLLASVYAFYRYVRAPSMLRLLLVGLCSGLALAAKHNGMFLFPILILLSICECARMIAEDRVKNTHVWKRPARLLTALVCISVLVVGVLWSFYGFRYSARPHGMFLKPQMSALTDQLRPAEARAITAMVKWKLLPESYLFGAADVLTVGEHYHSYLLGRIYPHGVWFYFPTVLTIKCTEALLALLLAAIAAIIFRRLWWQREILFLAIPAAVCLAIPMAAHLNTGVRHIMPVYAFLWPLAAGGARISWHAVDGVGA